ARDRNNCHLRPDSALATFALWDQAKTALLAAAITLERSDYRFDKVQWVRAFDVLKSELRDVSLTEAETHGTKPWTSVPAERLQQYGYAVEDDSGMTFFAPDLDVLASRYFSDTHCLHFNSGHGADGAMVGLDFEPAERPRHVEIRGTLWLDSTTSEL